MTERLLSNRYRLENRIGGGGMATVYAGLDTVLRRRVAIKELRPQFAADEDFVKRFYTEAHHAAKLSHPNVVNIYDVGHEDDTYFIVMELVDGTTLAEMIEHDGRLPEPVVIDYATQICAGLAYAHRQGLLHRDVKPANILVTKDDVVKLSDFGIARAVTTQTVTVTQPGLVMGSVYYLSPEQAQGFDLHESSDLYSLGVVLFQMLTGKLPYTGESPITVALKHVSNPIPPLETEDGSEISPALRAIVTKLLQKDPATRFQSATEVAAALREAREQPSVSSLFDVAASSVPRQTIGLRTIPNPKPRPTNFPDRALVTAGRDGRRFAPDDEDDVPVQPRRGWKAPSLPVIVIALAIAFIAGFMLFSRGGWFGPSNPVVLDDYVGRSVDDARQALAAAGLGDNEIATPSETIPKGRVIRQDPATDAKVARRSVVTLYVSNGLPVVEVIDLRQYSRDDAERYLRNKKLVPKVVLRYDSKAPKNQVMSQTPAPGTQLPIRSVITLVVSQGQKPIAVPELVQLSLNDARRTAATRGLKLEVSERVPNDTIPPDVVIGQNPPPGSKVDPNSTITVVVSDGAPLLGVPDVGGRNVAEALSALQGAGLSSRITYVVDPNSPAGTVMQQDPAASSQARKNSLVTLTVAVPGSIPDVIGMPLDQARTVLQNAGYKIGNVYYGASGDPGKVVATDPPAGQSLRPGETVALHVAGPPQ
jgi:serine/threonine-protein kinase